MSQRKADLEAELRQAGNELLALVKGLSDEDFLRKTECEAWTIKDLIAHLNSTEPGLAKVVRLIATGQSTAVAGFDIHNYNQRQVEKRRDIPVSQMLADLSAAQQQSVALLASLSDADLDRRGVMGTGQESNVADVFRLMASHTREHFGQISRALA